MKAEVGQEAWRGDCTGQLFGLHLPSWWVHAACVEACPVSEALPLLVLVALGALPARNVVYAYLLLCCLLDLTCARGCSCLWIPRGFWSFISNQAKIGKFLCSLPLPVDSTFPNPLSTDVHLQCALLGGMDVFGAVLFWVLWLLLFHLFGFCLQSFI